MGPGKSLVDLIALFDNVPLGFESNHSPYYRLLLAPDARPHGFIHPNTITTFPWPPSFTINHASSSVTLSPPPATLSPAPHANTAFQEAVDAAIACNKFPALAGRHSEHVRILGARAGPGQIIQLERFAAPLFGIATRGAHLTAYVPSAHGPQIWVARRSRHLHSYPGKLDSTVAGGIKAIDTPLSCILAESHEEANLSAAVTSRIRSAGALTLAHCSAEGVFHGDVVHVYDVELTAAETPQPGNDDEVEAFALMGWDEVRRRMQGGEFKPNVCAVMVDFAVRHGLVTAESEGEAEFVEACARLRRRLPVPVVA